MANLPSGELRVAHEPFQGKSLIKASMQFAQYVSKPFRILHRSTSMANSLEAAIS